jgi:hypothetical protein
MNRNACIFGCLVLTLGALGGCSSQPANDAKKAARPLDKIQGKAQVLIEQGGTTDMALNGGGSSSIYLWQGLRRYRLFVRTPVDVTHGDEYVAEGIWAQKYIDEIGDPDQGKNGYPLNSSCQRVVTAAWNNLSFDAIDANTALVKARVQRYPARPLFLVTRIRPATADEIKTVSTEATKPAAKNIPEVSVPAEKEKALLIEGPTVQTAPLWKPEGGTASCKVVIDTDGKISELGTGAQLCEAVPWDMFKYQPPVQGGRPVKVDTEVEIRFDARK